MEMILDLYCCEGGAGRGYLRSGFVPVGVDLVPQPRYPYAFVQANALTVLQVLLDGGTLDDLPGEPGPYTWAALGDFTAIHASPPCQHYSGMSRSRPGLADEYPDLIAPTRELLEMTGLPYIIENVEGAQDELRDPFVLCMDMFGVPEISRDRWFETNFPVMVPEHAPHKLPRMKAGRWEEGYALTPVGHFPGPGRARELMDVAWMSREGIAECVPPVFTEHIGRSLAAHLLTNMG